METSMQTVKFHEVTDTYAYGSYEDKSGNTVPATFTRQVCRMHSFHEPWLNLNYWMDANQSEERRDYGSW